MTIIEELAKGYMTAPAYEAPLSLLREFRQFVIDLAKVELQGVNFEYVDYQPYFRGPDLCLNDIKADFEQGNVKISAQYNESDLLGKDVNLIYRCIHERHHVKLDVDFGWEGECAIAAHIMSFTDNLFFKQLLFSEGLGQVAVRLHTGEFPDYQKVVLFDEEVIHCMEKTMKNVRNIRCQNH
ncbi:MAG: hypothetical protein F6K50_17320 [Moorea sp. SIO3I7]|uniref:hypothetical protein n=1 Tax=unclassified Moorena TaxID=2683338 RepID=UPI0013C08791|nr:MULTISPECIES: hypothetical protein [unclassified Moorena]NEN97224.1 hypothetical protein [Moorena sp. SIO3I7]NEO07581.1 hypothetical protein [Moorena sp. SIO3I8]NEO23080.1 hypothetical protein [Moorena sp. SIO4A5]NEP26085.1 hypothetical protein [Moorena sp. SIO3I6]